MFKFQFYKNILLWIHKNLLFSLLSFLMFFIIIVLIFLIGSIYLIHLENLKCVEKMESEIINSINKLKPFIISDSISDSVSTMDNKNIGIFMFISVIILHYTFFFPFLINEISFFSINEIALGTPSLTLIQKILLLDFNIKTCSYAFVNLSQIQILLLSVYQGNKSEEEIFGILYNVCELIPYVREQDLGLLNEILSQQDSIIYPTLLKIIEIYS